jgi:lauroyl/myristoyl acyltransferase
MNMGEAGTLAKQGRNVLIYTGHQMNWEYGNWVMSGIPGNMGGCLYENKK